MSSKKSNSAVTDKIVKYIHSNIESGKWLIGTKIESEPQIAKSLGVSRASVRGAIRQFIALGILESVQGKGTFVISLNAPDSFRLDLDETADCTGYDVTEFRLLLEPEICELAVERITNEEIQELQHSIDMMMATNDDDCEEFLKWDNTFHLILAKAAQNPIVEHTMVYLINARFAQTMETRKELGKYVGYYYHQKILDAIKQRNSVLAKQMMVEHIQMICRVLPREQE